MASRSRFTLLLRRCLNLILLVGVVICGAGAVLTFALIRRRDFVAAAVGETLAEEPGEERLAA